MTTVEEMAGEDKKVTEAEWLAAQPKPIAP